MVESRISAGATDKITWPDETSRKNSRVVIRCGRVIRKSRVERYCELANKETEQLHKVLTPCLDDNHFKKRELETVRELSKVCSQIVLKFLYLARIGRLDILWSVNKLALDVTKLTRACDNRSARVISYIHHTSDRRQYCHVGTAAQHCRLGLLQDSDFAGDLDDSKSTSW